MSRERMKKYGGGGGVIQGSRGNVKKKKKRKKKKERKKKEKLEIGTARMLRGLLGKTAELLAGGAGVRFFFFSCHVEMCSGK